MKGVRDSLFHPVSDLVLEVGKPVVDPVFGTEVCLIAGDDGTDCTHYYFWSPVFNANGTLMLIFRDWVAWIYSYDPVAFTATPLCPLSATPLNSASAQWDRSNPDVLYVIEATPRGGIQKQRILKINVATRNSGELRRFKGPDEVPGCELDKLDLSDDGTVMAFMATDAAGKVTACVWDRTADKLHKFTQLALDTPIHGVSLSRDGQWLMVAMSNPTPDIAFWHWRDKHTVYADCRDSSKSGFLNHVYMGSVVVSGGPVHNGVVIRDYDFSDALEVFRFRRADGRDNWNIAHHAALRTGPNGAKSIIVSTYDVSSTPDVFSNEIIEVFFDGSWRRLGPTRSLRGDGDFVDGNYPAQPRATAQRDVIVWTADLRGTGKRSVLMMRIPPLEAEQELERQAVNAATAFDIVAADRDAARAECDEARASIIALADHAQELNAELSAASAERDAAKAERDALAAWQASVRAVVGA